MHDPRVEFEIRELPEDSGQYYVAIKGSSEVLSNGPFARSEAERLVDALHSDENIKALIKERTHELQAIEVKRQAEGLIQSLQDDFELDRLWEDILCEYGHLFKPSPGM